MGIIVESYMKFEMCHSSMKVMWWELKGESSVRRKERSISTARVKSFQWGKLWSGSFFAKTLPEMVFLDGLFFSLCCKRLKSLYKLYLKTMNYKTSYATIFFKKMVFSEFKLYDTDQAFSCLGMNQIFEPTSEAST